MGKKAFDKIRHDKLYEAMSRMGIPENIVNIVKATYENASFCVEMDNSTSEWKRQATGIRQGCPLSPYLFIIVMSVMFHDIHQEDKVKTKEHRVVGTEQDEVLYADDTICISRDENAMNRLLSAIEREGKKYGMGLNKGKCEHLAFGGAGQVTFADGSEVSRKTEVKFLGCMMNEKGT